MKKHILFPAFCLLITSFIYGQPVYPVMQQEPAIPAPSSTQLQWHEMEFYLFVHFGPNTFTDAEWGKGTEQEEVFNPTALDCNQWCRVAKAAGAKGIIITAKHHDGFCLWPSKYSTHTVRESKWKNGKGDVLKELSEACKANGLKFGVYLSPWDRNHPAYGTPAYNDVYVNMMQEIVTNYGPLFEMWWDGANGEGPNGKQQVYDFKRFEKTIRSLAPKTLVFSDIGPDIRWCGNENGIAGTTNWNLLDTAGFTRGAGAPPVDTLNQGNMKANNWIPAECDVSIRPGWFYHQQEDSKVKTPQQLFDLYLKSVGRGANLLLNVPPDRSGLINAHDSASLVGFYHLREDNFKNNLLDEKSKNVTLTWVHKNLNDPNREHLGVYAVFNTPVKVNCIVIKEDIRKGQFIKNMNITLSKKGEVIKTIHITTVGRKRIITFPAVEAGEITLAVASARYTPYIKGVEAYLIDEKLVKL